MRINFLTERTHHCILGTDIMTSQKLDTISENKILQKLVTLKRNYELSNLQPLSFHRRSLAGWTKPEPTNWHFWTLNGIFEIKIIKKICLGVYRFEIRAFKTQKFLWAHSIYTINLLSLVPCRRKLYNLTYTTVDR